MKILLPLLSLAILMALTGCGDRAYYPTGRPAYAGYSNFRGRVIVKTKDFYFEQNGERDTATPTKATIESTGNVLMKLGVGAAGGAAVP